MVEGVGTLKVVTKETEKTLELSLAGVTLQSTDAEIIAAAERGVEQELKGYVVSRKDTNLLVSPAPVFG